MLFVGLLMTSTFRLITHFFFNTTFVYSFCYVDVCALHIFFLFCRFSCWPFRSSCASFGMFHFPFELIVCLGRWSVHFASPDLLFWLRSLISFFFLFLYIHFVIMNCLWHFSDGGRMSELGARIKLFIKAVIVINYLLAKSG